MTREHTIHNDLKNVDNDVPDYHDLQLGEDEKLVRMRDRPDRKIYMLYPEDRFKINWDLLIAFVLIITCSITPVTLAFYEEESAAMMIFNAIINILFGFDIIIIFFTAFYNDDFVLIDDLP